MESADYDLSITVAHPYYPQLGLVTLVIPVVTEPPGTPVRNLGRAPLTAVRSEHVWTPLTTAYTLSGHFGPMHQAALAGLVWDLRGEPIHPSLGRRAAGRFALVRNDDKTFTLWRPSIELQFSADERAHRLREEALHCPDARRREAA